MNIKLKFLLGVFLLFGTYAKSIAQNRPVSSGGVATGSGGTASYSVGEVAYTTITGNGGIVIEGLQQAYTTSDLPISLLQLTASVFNKNEVAINWTTVSEINNQYFTVQRSIDGVSYNDIAKIVGADNSVSKQCYQLIDSTPMNGISYYRLKQTDADGKESYSSIVSVNISTSESELTAYPNPTLSYLNLKISNMSSKKLGFRIVSLEGKVIFQQLIKDNLTTINTSTLNSGTYILSVTNDNTLIKSFKIIKN